MAILKAKSMTQMKGISARIPADLHTEIEAIKTAAEAAGFSFSVTDLVTEALYKAVKQARNELASVTKPEMAPDVFHSVIQESITEASDT